jgi:Flp pilus assembly pilin Flp
MLQLSMLLTYLDARLRNEKGEVSIEYALVGGLVAIAIIAGFVTFGPAITNWFDGIGDMVSGSVPAPAAP